MRIGHEYAHEEPGLGAGVGVVGLGIVRLDSAESF